jgi:hypothetical protein
MKSVLATCAIRLWRGCSKSVLAIGVNCSQGRPRSTAAPDGPAPSPGPLPAPPPHAGSPPSSGSPPGRPARHGLARGLQGRLALQGHLGLQGRLSRRSRPCPAGQQLRRALSGRDVVGPRNFANGWPFFAARAFEALLAASRRAFVPAGDGLQRWGADPSGRRLLRRRSRAASGIARGRGSSGSRRGKSGRRGGACRRPLCRPADA